jgi:hypothetical protein
MSVGRCWTLACIGVAWSTAALAADPLPAPGKLRASASVAECAAAAPAATACEDAFKSGGQSLAWEWAGASGQIDGFRVYRNQDGSTIRIADKVNDALRMIMIEPLKGQQNGPSCYSVRAYKGLVESASSNEVCLAAPPRALPPAPISLRLTNSASECAAAAGSISPGAICEVVLKDHGQVLVFNWAGAADIDGFRLYDSVNGKPVLHETKYDPDQRVFLIPPASVGKVSDYCFQVRAFSGERESWPTNTVCVAPPKALPAPVSNGAVLALVPSGGTLLTGVETTKNFNPGCPYPPRTVKTRTKVAFADGVRATNVYRDLNSVCGERTLMWSEGSAEFALSALPARFVKATLKFVSEGGDASTGCVRDLFAYNMAIRDNSPGGARFEKLGDPLAWFTFHKAASIANGASLAPQGGNAFDVTALLRQSIQRNYKTQGFNFAVNQDMKGGNHACAAGYKAFVLEIES